MSFCIYKTLLIQLQPRTHVNMDISNQFDRVEILLWGKMGKSEIIIILDRISDFKIIISSIIQKKSIY